MAAKKNNTYWKLRTKSGRNKKYETVDDLWDRAVSYFEWVEANPLQEEQLITYQGEGFKYSISKMRAMTFEGLCLHLGISYQTWQNYKSVQDFLEVISDIECIIRTQKFEGAAAGLLNANITARDLSLRDSIQMRHFGKVNMPDYSTWSDQELEIAVDRLMSNNLNYI